MQLTLTHRLTLTAAALLLLPGAMAAQDRPWRLAVVSESGDIVTWLAHRGDSLVVERTVPVGIMPADIDGPHNVAVSPDGAHYYISIAHGQPWGTLWKLDANTDEVQGRAPLELFPTTIALTPDGELAFVANSDFHGDRPRVNMVSVVYTPTMTKITDLALCDMPHGVKVSRSGTRAYVSCMHSDELIELDVSSIDELRRVPVGTGHKPAAAAAPAAQADPHAGHAAPAPAAGQPATAPAPAAAPGAHAARAGAPSGECSPTFATLSPDDATIYVPCNYKDVLQVWDAATLTLRKEIPTGKGPYNAEPSPDGRWLLVTNKKDQSVSLIDTGELTEAARLRTTKKIVHGVAWSPDGKFVYVSQESIGADPGAVDVIDVATRKTVATVAVPAQPTGISLRRLSTPANAGR
jgi:DNA-binding beta-propeller fold protein YncE